MMMKSQSLASLGLAAAVLLCAAAAAGTGTDLKEECSAAFEKVATCLSYATGKAAAPSKECCGSITEIKSSEPVCLCYIMQQTHNGSEQIKSMGVQEAKLLQLPTACKLTNASVSYCPKLLNIPEGSPDAAVFTNSNATSTTPTPATGMAATTTGGDNIGSMHSPNLAGLIAIAVAVFFFSTPMEIVLTFHT